MTIATTVNKTIAYGNGVSTVFTFNFMIPAGGEEQITYTSVAGVSTVLTSSQYTVTGFGVSTGGTVTYNPSGVPIPSGSSLTIARILPLTQNTSLSNQGSNYPAVTETALDYAMMVAQQISEAQNRNLVVPITDPAPALPLPSATARANKALMFDASGNPIAGTAPASGTISTAMQPICNAATLDIARAALGFSTAPTPSGRLSLVAAVEVPTSDIAAASTVYYVGNIIPFWNGSQFVSVQVATQPSLALDSNSGHTGYQASGNNYDLFLFQSGTSVLMGTGPGWSTGTTRGTGAGTTELQQVQGLWTNKNAITLRYGTAAGSTTSIAANLATFVGTIRTTADGQTEDSLTRRFVSNCYNQVPREMYGHDGTATWTYSTATWRQANANTANLISFLQCLDGNMIKARAMATATSSALAQAVTTGIGLSRVNANDASYYALQYATTTQFAYPLAFYEGYPGLGYNYLGWLEYGAGADTQTWYGLNFPTGIYGEVWA